MASLMLSADGGYPKRALVRAYVTGSLVAVGGVLYGYDTGLISGILVMPEFRRHFSTGFRNAEGDPDFTPGQTSLVVSILSAGTFAGALSSASAGDYFGRKWTLIIANIVFIIRVLLQSIAGSLPLFNAGRFFAGGGVGLLSPLVPVYISETSPREIRGSIVTLYPWIVTWGLLIAAVVNNATKDRANTGAFRIPIALQFGFSMIVIGALLILPETPRLLVKKGQLAQARASLSRLRGLDPEHPVIFAELEEIQITDQVESEQKETPFRAIFRGTIAKRLLTGCMIQAFSQLCGINFIFYYGTQFFERTGIKDPFVTQMITNSVNVAFTIPGLLLADRWGRRGLLLLGAAGMAVSQLIIAVVGGVDTGSQAANIVLVALACVFVAFFAMSWAPCGRIVTGEIFPLHFRAKCVAITTATNWLCNWALAFATPYLINGGPGNADLGVKVFAIWGSCAALAFLLVYIMVYETKGLSLERIDELYAVTSKAWQSKPIARHLRLHPGPTTNATIHNDDNPKDSSKDKGTVACEHIESSSAAAT